MLERNQKASVASLGGLTLQKGNEWGAGTGERGVKRENRNLCNEWSGVGDYVRM